MNVYAIFSECTGDSLTPPLGTEEMKPYLPNRIFNKEEARGGPLGIIAIADPTKGDRITLKNGTYRINGMSFITMFKEGKNYCEPVSLFNLRDVYAGYCILYKSDLPPVFKPVPDMKGVICFGTMGSAYDSGPSLFDCVLKVHEPSGHLDISLGHQCGYENHTDADGKAYLRIGGSDYHISARIAIFKMD